MYRRREDRLGIDWHTWVWEDTYEGHGGEEFFCLHIFFFFCFALDQWEIFDLRPLLHRIKLCRCLCLHLYLDFFFTYFYYFRCGTISLAQLCVCFIFCLFKQADIYFRAYILSLIKGETSKDKYGAGFSAPSRNSPKLLRKIEEHRHRGNAKFFFYGLWHIKPDIDEPTGNKRK
jgi:hypothetical protein